MNKTYRISPPGLWLIAGTIAAVAGIWLLWYSIGRNSMELLIPSAFFVFFTAMIIYDKVSKSFTLDKEGITCLRFGRPYKKVTWDQAVQVGIVAVSGPFTGGATPYIVVTLEGADKYDMSADIGGEYISKWKDSLIVIYRTDKAVEYFEKLYGKLDYICSNG